MSTLSHYLTMWKILCFPWFRTILTYCDMLWHDVTCCDILWHVVTLCRGSGLEGRGRERASFSTPTATFTRGSGGRTGITSSVHLYVLYSNGNIYEGEWREDRYNQFCTLQCTVLHCTTFTRGSGGRTGITSSVHLYVLYSTVQHLRWGLVGG